MIETLQRNAAHVAVNSETQSSEPLDPRILSSVLVSVKLSPLTEDPSKDPHARLLELMHSPAVRALLDSAQGLAQREGIGPQVALQQIILNLKEIDHLWGQVLLKEGLARLSSQFH